MTAEQFVYWLQGFAELNAQPPTPEQWQAINEHLQTVFVKVTSAYPQFGVNRTLEVRPTDLFPQLNITC